MYYSLLYSKEVQDMLVVLEWFLETEHKNDTYTKKLFKEYLIQHPVQFSNSEKEQLDIYERLLASLDTNNIG